MFCTKCGKEVSDNAKFCNGCGNPIVRPEGPQKPVRPETPAPEPMPKENQKKSGKGWIVLVIVLTVLAALAAGWFFVGKDLVEEKFFSKENSKEVDDDEDVVDEEETTGDDTEEVDVDKILKKYTRYMTRTYGEDTAGMTINLVEDEIPEYLVYIKGAAGDFIAILQYRDGAVEEVMAQSKVAAVQYIEGRGKFFFETNETDGTATTLYELDEDGFCTEIGSCAVTSKGYFVENSVVTEADYNKYIRKYEVIDQRLGTRVNVSTADYVLPDSSTRYLTKADLEGLTKDECRIARNEIYARYGRKFNDEALQAYFNAKSWYKPTMEADAFKEDMLNKYEVANRDLIVEYEKEKGFR